MSECDHDRLKMCDPCIEKLRYEVETKDRDETERENVKLAKENWELKDKLSNVGTNPDCQGSHCIPSEVEALQKEIDKLTEIISKNDQHWLDEFAKERKALQKEIEEVNKSNERMREALQAYDTCLCDCGACEKAKM